MHSRTGWSPVLNATIASAAVLFLVVSIQPQPRHVAESLKLFTGSIISDWSSNQSDYRQASELAIPDSLPPSQQHVSMRLITVNQLTDEALALISRKPVKSADVMENEIVNSHKAHTSQFEYVSHGQPVSDGLQSPERGSPEVQNHTALASISGDQFEKQFEVNGRASTTWESSTESQSLEISELEAVAVSPFQQVSTSKTIAEPVVIQEPEPPVTLPEQSERIEVTTETAEEPSLAQEGNAQTSEELKLSQAEANGVRRSEKPWPEPTALRQIIETLSGETVTSLWARETLEVLDYLHEHGDLLNAETTRILNAVEHQRKLLARIYQKIQAENARRPDQKWNYVISQIQRIDYQMSRRLAIWNRAHELAMTPTQDESDRDFVNASSTTVQFNVHENWRDYLMVSEAESVFNSKNASRKSKQKMARLVLSRAYSPSLTTTQSGFARSSIQGGLEEFLLEQARSSVDYQKLLEVVEKHELKPSGVTQYVLNDQYQNLFWSRQDEEQQLALEIDRYYRNSNCRIAVSERFINRLLPQFPETSEPLSENVDGMRIFGQNRIQNQLGLELIPDPNQINLQVVTNGNVYSTIFAEKSGFQIESAGTAKYHVQKRLAFTRDGIFSSSPVAATTANQQPVGITSRLDTVPVVGRIARRIAQRKVDSETPKAEQMFRQRVESSASSRVQKEVESGVAQIRGYLYNNLYQPLLAMDLEPDPIEMSTHSNEVVIRYRLAGRDQLAANSARPVAPANSLMDVQVHQTAINNLLNRIGLNGKKFTLQELAVHLEDRVGLKLSQEDLEEHEASLEFSSYDPIRIDFEDDRLQFSLNLKSFRLGKNGKKWRNMSVKTTYVPQVQGRKVVFVQEEPGIRLKGRKFKLRDQIAVRAIFKVLLQESYSTTLISDKFVERFNSPNLVLDQFLIRNGWLGIAINELVPQQSQPTMSRGNGRLFRWRR